MASDMVVFSDIHNNPRSVNFAASAVGNHKGDGPFDNILPDGLVFNSLCYVQNKQKKREETENDSQETSTKREIGLA